MLIRLFVSYKIYLILIVLTGCGAVQTIFKQQSPHEQYSNLLQTDGLAQTVLAQKWIAAGKHSLQNATFMELPLSCSGFFAAGNPRALAYKSYIEEGRIIQLKASVTSESKAQLFIDIFNKSNKQQWKRIAFADSTYKIEYEVKRSDTFLIRLQPEALVNMNFSLLINTNPQLINPVLGADNKSIGSFFGDSRANGKRIHEGVDIFAAHGTAVLAPTNGFIARVGSNNLGGKVVWMRDHKLNQSYYFAHLDSQRVATGQKISKGDTIGFVGNTGNAKHTPPHLHFGIYQSGSKDPLPYIFKSKTINQLPKLQANFSQPVTMRVTREVVNMRSGPSTKNKINQKLNRNEYLEIIVIFADWYQVQQADSIYGFVADHLLDSLRPLATYALIKETELLVKPQLQSVRKSILDSAESVKFLARYNGYQLIETDDKVQGWVRKEQNEHLF